MYNLTFQEAIEKCTNGEGFIRGEAFKDGVYVKKQGETLVAVDGFNLNRSVGNLYISIGIMTQRYKLFKELTAEELTSSSVSIAMIYDKAV